jgi:hypothetical protein
MNNLTGIFRFFAITSSKISCIYRAVFYFSSSAIHFFGRVYGDRKNRYFI